MSDREAFDCPWHGFTIEPDNDDGCPVCLRDYRDDARDPATMTPDERVAQVERLCGIVTVAVPVLLERLNQLVGRPVYTHEIALRYDALLDEARRRTGVTPMDEVIGSLEDTGLPVMVVEPEDGER